MGAIKVLFAFSIYCSCSYKAIVRFFFWNGYSVLLSKRNTIKNHSSFVMGFCTEHTSQLKSPAFFMRIQCTFKCLLYPYIEAGHLHLPLTYLWLRVNGYYKKKNVVMVPITPMVRRSNSSSLARCTALEPQSLLDSGLICFGVVSLAGDSGH